MPMPSDDALCRSESNPAPDSPLVRAVRDRTPARILVGRAGGSYRTATLLSLRRDHAAALDAVHAEVDPRRDWGDEFIRRFNLFEVQTKADSKTAFLMRPDLGRQLTDESRRRLTTECPAEVDFQVAIADGLSAAAVIKQVPELLPLLLKQAQTRGLKAGRPFFIHHGRVGVLNDIGEVLRPAVVVLLIGERPGLATAESLSAYMAYRPRPGHTDADRNLISNIHARGVPPAEAAPRIMALAAAMMRQGTSGTSVKETLTAITEPPNRELP